MPSPELPERSCSLPPRLVLQEGDFEPPETSFSDPAMTSSTSTRPRRRIATAPAPFFTRPPVRGGVADALNTRRQKARNQPVLGNNKTGDLNRPLSWALPSLSPKRAEREEACHGNAEAGTISESVACADVNSGAARADVNSGAEVIVPDLLPGTHSAHGSVSQNGNGWINDHATGELHRSGGRRSSSRCHSTLLPLLRIALVGCALIFGICCLLWATLQAPTPPTPTTTITTVTQETQMPYVAALAAILCWICTYALLLQRERRMFSEWIMADTTERACATSETTERTEKACATSLTTESTRTTVVQPEAGSESLDLDACAKLLALMAPQELVASGYTPQSVMAAALMSECQLSKQELQRYEDMYGLQSEDALEHGHNRTFSFNDLPMVQ